MPPLSFYKMKLENKIIALNSFFLPVKTLTERDVCYYIPDDACKYSSCTYENSNPQEITSVFLM